VKNNIYPIDAKGVEAEAAQWIVRLDGDHPPKEEDLAELKEWLNRSPAHRQALADMARFWSNNVLTELSIPLDKSQPGAGKNSDSRVKLAAASLTAVAASIVAVIFFATSWFAIDTDDSLYVTALGQQRDVVLDDGSSVHLNTNTQIDIAYSKAFRDIHLLQGEAYFNVAKDPSRPFRVYVGNSRVEAVGTAFSIYQKGRSADVIVTEGVVAVSTMPPQENNLLTRQPGSGVLDGAGGGSALLTKGQKTTLKLDETDQVVVKEIENIKDPQLETSLAWRQGYIAFKGESLKQVVEEISRYTPVTIDISDPEIEGIQIGGQLRIGDTESMLAALESNFGLEIKRLGYNHVQLSLAAN